MRKKLFITLIVFSFLSVTSLGIFLVSTTASTNNDFNYTPLDIGWKLRNMEVDLDTELNFREGSTSFGLKTSAGVGDIGTYATWIWYDDVTGLYLADYRLRAVGEYCEVWVMDDLSWYDPDDPRDVPVVTDEQCWYLVEEFDNNIYPTTTGYYGQEDFHDGNLAALPFGYFDEAGKSVILISNVGDENWYDYTYPSYIAGFYWGSVFEYYCDRNVISIDAYDWVHRLGDKDNDWFLNDDNARPNLYESTIAHEYQHLIHDDWLGGDETWMNEACSLFAEPLCGYPIDWGQVEWFLTTPDNSLTQWGDQGGYNILADYGASFLWSMYVADHYGHDFWSRYVKGDPMIPDLKLSAIPRITGLLPEGIDFYDVFHDWRIANLIHSNKPGWGKYNYKSFDLGDVYPMTIHDMPGKKIGWTSAAEEFGYTLTHPSTFYPDGVTLDPIFAPPDGVTKVGPFSTEYIRFPDMRGIDVFWFNGDDAPYYPYTWERFYYDSENPMFDPVLDGAWWSGIQGDLKNVLLAGEVAVPDVANPSLNLLTYWDIEDYWDFGFVQVSTDGGETWVSLANEYTTSDHDPQAYYGIVDNLPGLTSWTAYITGELYTPISISFDLTPYAGDSIQLGFRFMTDWNTEYDGWFIVDAAITEGSVIGLPGEVSGTSIMDDLAPVPKEADFMVTLVEAKITPSGNVICKQVKDMWLKCDSTEWGVVSGLIRSEAKDAILIVSYVGEFGTVDYEFKAKSYRWRGWRGWCSWY
ncbi:MAG: hypothetical protein ACFFEY_02255 [Candidatus Thorarchaeota archaeon]